MKKIIFYAILLSVAFTWSACKKGNYEGGKISPYIPMLDLRALYKGSDVTLTTENMYGSDKITGIVISDYTGNNMPEGGLLVLQDRRRLNTLRGISIPLGVTEASKYVSGDSITVTVAGGVLTRVNGLMEITNIPASAVTKIASGKTLLSNRVPSSSILNNPSDYESTLVSIVKGGFDPLPTPSDKFGGDKTVNDGFENITMHTDATATFANTALPVTANFTGIIFVNQATDGKVVPLLRMRKASDIQVLSSTIEITPIVIAGFLADALSTDANYEYIQLLATKDINFATTPFSVVTTNNAGASTPTGFPANGWATGDVRTYKFNLTSGSVTKGQYFYVGGTTKVINGGGSASIASSAWIRSFNYSTTNGDGFGTKTSNLLANSGNAFGMAVFSGTTVTKDTQPIDVIFVSNGGNLFSAGPPAVGYKIANTDLYDVVNPITLATQPYYLQGSNTLFMKYYTAAQGFFYKLGGVYNPRLGKWVKARTSINFQVSQLSEIEGDFPEATETDPAFSPTKLAN